VFPDLEKRTAFIKQLAEVGVHSVFHYVPLHTSPAGKKNGRSHGDLTTTLQAGDRLVRLPLWSGMPDADLELSMKAADQALRRSP
jgi:dTDP-4-amino-4,6-dideoxygalactose transaminase